MKEKVRIGKEEIEKMMENSREVMKFTLELNTKYNSAQEIVELMSKITGKPVDKSFALLFIKNYNLPFLQNFNLNCDEKHKFKTISINISRIISC